MGKTNELSSFPKQLSGMLRDVYSVNKRKGNLIVLLKAMTALLPLAHLYLVKALIDQVTNTKTEPMQVMLMVTFFAGIQILTTGINQYANHLESLFSQEVSDAFSLKIIQKASLVSYPHYENPAFHNNLHLAQQQARYRIVQLLPAINGGIANGMSLVFLLLFFVSIKAYLFLAIFFFAIPITLNKWWQGKKAADLEFSLAPKERESAYLFQLMTGFQWAKELRTFGFGKSMQERFQSHRTEINQKKKTNQQSSLKQNLLAEVLEVVALGFAIGYLALKTISKALGLGSFVLYLQGIQRMQSSAKAFFQSMLQVVQLRSFVKDLYVFFDLSEEKIQDQKENFPEQLNQLTIESLSFTYPDHKTPILNNINIEASKGEIIAIVGENGAGKSTLVKLLAGFYTPNNGTIAINSIPLNAIRRSEYYQQSSFFFQDYEKYFLTAGQNIHFDYLPTSTVDQQTRLAAQSSGADDFIRKLSKGYDTKMGSIFEGSEQLSGGQWQKLALARIFYKDAKLVVLDEPSSALDAFAELNLYQQIKTASKDKIVVLISHRLYNLKLADKIYVMQEGEIVQVGRFDQLIVEEGLFKSMYEKQRI